MIPVMQTTFYDETSEGKTRGNCFGACVASVLEVPIHAVPDWPRLIFGVSNWMLHVQLWLNCYGLEIETVGRGGPNAAPWEGSEEYYIVSGPSPRFDGKIWHSCVWHKGKIVHDPHPDGTGLAECREWELIRKVHKWDPAE